jgi:putative NADH-flavin reductase
VPVIVVGADTSAGDEIVAALARNAGEMRAFITDPDRAEALRKQGCKVAIGDVSDASHIEIAAFECFTAVVVAEAASDDRERAFAADPGAVAGAWMEAISDARIHRLIWIGSGPLPEPPEEHICPEVVTLHGDRPGFAQEVARLNELEALG